MMEGAYISTWQMHLAPNKAFNQELLHGCHFPCWGSLGQEVIRENFQKTCKAMRPFAFPFQSIRRLLESLSEDQVSESEVSKARFREMRLIISNYMSVYSPISEIACGLSLTKIHSFSSTNLLCD